MKGTKIGAWLCFLGAAVCLGVIWPMWAATLRANQEAPPYDDGTGIVLVGVFMLSCFLVAGAVVMVAVAIMRLRRK